MEKEKLNIMAKKFVPDGFKLEKDRSYNAKVVLDPDNPANFKRWKKNTNKVDLRGFDTRKEKELSLRQVLKKSSLGYIESEPDRFVAEGYETRRLIDSIADKIYDKESMIKEITSVWKRDNGLRSFWDSGEWITKGDWEALFKTGYIQGIIKNNVVEPVLSAIRDKYKVSDFKARQVFEKLSEEKINLIYQATRRGKIKQIKIIKKKKTINPILASIPRAKRQMSKGGIFYQRTKPQIWSKMQEKFLINNSKQPILDLFKVYNSTFSVKRTMGSLQNKIYRLKKK